MSDNSIGASAFLFISLICIYFYWVKDHEHIFKWKTFGALVIPVLFRLVASGIEDYLQPTLWIRIQLEVIVFCATWFLIMNSCIYFASIGRFLSVPSACKGCRYYHGMDIICAVHPSGPVDNTCNDYQF